MTKSFPPDPKIPIKLVPSQFNWSPNSYNVILSAKSTHLEMECDNTPDTQNLHPHTPSPPPPHS